MVLTYVYDMNESFFRLSRTSECVIGVEVFFLSFPIETINRMDSKELFTCTLQMLLLAFHINNMK